MATFEIGNPPTFSTDYVISVEISDRCIVARRPVTCRTAGEEIDTGTFTDKPTHLTVTLRLSDDDKTLIEEEWEGNVLKIIYLRTIEGDEQGYWTFPSAWIFNKNIAFENSVGSDGVNRKWLTTLVIIAETAIWTAV